MDDAREWQQLSPQNRADASTGRDVRQATQPRSWVRGLTPASPYGRWKGVLTARWHSNCPSSSLYGPRMAFPKDRPTDVDAESQNRRMIKSIELRASKPDAVLAFSLADYRRRLDADGGEHPLHDLTRHLVGTHAETAASIRRRMEKKWAEAADAQRLESSVTNSLRRSAGTNYQSLVTYALARFLLARQSHWYVVHPVPKDWAHLLSIKFTGGVLEEAPRTVEADDMDEAASIVEEGAPADDSVSVKPDLDILLRNDTWDAENGGKEPALVLSVKTSLADRAGSAARWKTYFDLVTRPCAHVGEETCAYRRLGIALEHSPPVDITHGIVTANIYKINSDPYYTRWGELRSNQSRANTFMFDVRYTTREETEEVMAEGWQGLANIEDWLTATAHKHGLQP